MKDLEYMKVIKQFFFLLVVLLITGTVACFFVAKPSETDLIALVPEDAIVVIDWDNPAEAWQAFADTPLGAALRKIEWPLILRTMGLATDDVVKIDKSIAFWDTFSQSLFFREILGERSVLALLDGKKGMIGTGETGTDEKKNIIDLLQNNIVLLNNSGRNVALFNTFLSTLPKSKLLPARTYQGYTISAYQLDNGYPVYFTTDKDLLIAALAPGPLQHCIDLKLDRILQKVHGMEENGDYIQYKKRAGGKDDFFLYVDIDRLKSSVQGQVSQTIDDRPDDNEQDWFFPEEGVNKAAFYHQNVQPVHQFVSIVGFDDAALPPFPKNIYTRPPVENRKLARMPAHLLAYFWTNWLDLPSWWQMTTTSATGTDAKRVERFSATIDQYTGMSIGKFLALFGNQVGLNIKEIKTSGFLPVPRLCFCVEMTDRRKIQTMLEKYLAGLPQHRNMVAGVPVVSVLAAGGLMQPSYALLKDFLILADGRDQIEDILIPGDALLVREPDFLEVDMGLQQQNNLVVFTRTAQLLDGLKELAAGLGTVMAVRDEQAGARMKILLDGAIIPLLDSLTMVKAQALRSYTAEEEIVLQATVLMAE